MSNILTTTKYKFALVNILGTDKFELRRNSVNQNIDNKLDIGKYQLMLSNNGEAQIIASFELHPMINCCGICVSTTARVIPEWRGKGLGTILNLLRIDIARQLGYGLLMCTDIESNIYQRKILKANGWIDAHSFINPRTKNRVYISVINL